MSQIQADNVVFTSHTPPRSTSVRNVSLPQRSLFRVTVVIAWVVCIPLTVALSELIANMLIATALPTRGDLRVYGKDAINFAPGLLLVCCLVFPLSAFFRSRSWWPLHPFLTNVATWATASFGFSFAPFLFAESRFHAYSSFDLLNDGSFLFGGAIAGCLFHLLAHRRNSGDRRRKASS